MALHGLENIHRGERGDIETREPHINDNGDLKRVVFILESPLHFLFMLCAPADLKPLLWVLIGHCHNNADFIFPIRAHL